MRMGFLLASVGSVNSHFIAFGGAIYNTKISNAFIVVKRLKGSLFNFLNAITKFTLLSFSSKYV